MSGNHIQFIGVCLIVLAMNSAAGAVEFAGGSGTLGDPYQIATAEQLISIGSDPDLLDKHFVLLNDIDLDPNLPGGRVFTQAVIAANARWMGSGAEDSFIGSFDGRGHRIRNMVIRSSTAHHVALFSGVGEEGVVKDLAVDGAEVVGQQGFPCSYGTLIARNEGRLVRCSAEAYVSGQDRVGVLVGSNSGEIIDCWSAGEAVGGEAVGGLAGDNSRGVILRSHASSGVVSVRRFGKWFGGLIGENCGGLVVDCYATGTVCSRGGGCFGGLVGGNTWIGIIVSSYATGKVFVEAADGWSLGGLVGNATEASIIYDCYATGDVNGLSNVGGLIGKIDLGGCVANSYCTGRVSGSTDGTHVGGMVGRKDVGRIVGCFWNTETSGLTTSAGGVGLTTTQMQNASTFISAGWDWVDEQANGTANPWFIPEGGGYPLLTVHCVSFQRHGLEGSGTADDPYRIATAEDLGAINHHDLGACYRLEADISLAGVAWHRAPIQYFEGRLDGAGKVVTGLKIEGDNFLGLFNRLGRQASVKSLGIRGASISGATRLGMLAGENRGHITACCADGTVSGDGCVGGLTGWNEGSISDSYVIGKVTGGQNPVTGGLTGGNFDAIHRCYAAAHVTSSTPPWFGDVTGGLVGSTDFAGMSIGETKDSYFLIDTDGGGPDNGLGIALTGVQMRQQGSFANWDFEGIWMICEGEDYPRLRWEPAQ